MEPISQHNRSYESQSRSTMTLGVGVRIIVFLIIGVVTYFAFTKGITLFSWHPTLMLIGVSNSSFGYVLFHIFQSSLSVSLSCDSEKQLCQPRTNQYIFSICFVVFMHSRCSRMDEYMNTCYMSVFFSKSLRCDWIPRNVRFFFRFMSTVIFVLACIYLHSNECSLCQWIWIICVFVYALFMCT